MSVGLLRKRVAEDLSPRVDRYTDRTASAVIGKRPKF